MNEELWLSYPENEPTDQGYYMTIHQIGDDLFHKAIYWDGVKWCKWKMSQSELHIHRYLERTVAKYYTECIRKFTERSDD